jgi:hypothetical protein
MRVRLIGKANGVGLSRDLELLGAALQASGCEVQQQPCDRRERRRRRSLLTRVSSRLRRLRIGTPRVKCDLNVMLEHVWPQFLHEARYNVLVPNPEWFDRRDSAMLRLIDRVWAKTSLTNEIFAARRCRTVTIGFDSQDRFEPDVTRAPRFLHLAGRSELKGTARLLPLWQRHPEWPQLTVVQDASAVRSRPDAMADNILYHSSYLDDAALRTLQNSHRFHLCLSEAEGWGHYIVEAMSVAAITLTTDARPMNELVSAERGVLVAAQASGQHNLARAALFDESALEAAVARSLAYSALQLAAIGAEARTWFLANKRDFPARVQRAVADIESTIRRAGP